MSKVSAVLLCSVAVACATATLSPSGEPIPTVEIAKGVHLPMVGLGTWQYNDTVAYAACKSALQLGYPHVDTAVGYFNAKGLGKCFSEHFQTSARSSLFITTKVMAGLPGAGNKSMSELYLEHLHDLQIDYADLLLLHFPCELDPDTGACTGGKALRQRQWLDIEPLVKAGKVRSIGVSHYCPRHLRDVFEVMSIIPAVNQVQYHVGMGPAGINATDGREFDGAVGILYQSFSPLCGPCGADAHMELINGPLVSGIGKNHNKTGSQVSLKWQIQQGIPVIPKSASSQHQTENLDLFGWELTEAEMQALSAATSPAVAGGADPTQSGDCTYA